MLPLLTRLSTIVLLLISGLVYAAPPSRVQIDQLLEVTRARETSNSMLPQLQDSLQQIFQQIFQQRLGEELSEQDQRELETMMAALMKRAGDPFSWEQLQTLYRDLYAQAFNADEAQAMIDFYSSPIGQSVAQKMPQLVDNLMQAIEAKMSPFLQKFDRELEAYLDESEHSH